MKIIIIILIFLLIITICYFYPLNEHYDNKNKYHINVFPQLKTSYPNKYILYKNNKPSIESNNNKSIWNAISSKYSLESINKNKTEHFDDISITKLKDNVYRLGDKYYLKNINNNIFHLSEHKDFYKLNNIIYHNYLKDKDNLTIKKEDSVLARITHQNTIKDRHHPKYNLYGDKYQCEFLDDSITPPLLFNLFYLIKEIHRSKYKANFDKK